ncbi:hypothetical protein [Roseiconus lacunae]|uniref:hypothetical protein n=1 Tax=Roseiconus lacunae TaxID=2605694 RepID=UPI001E56D61E|nr:hypothetical protein [Roseiconus lacunae]MCD0458469.1 hypothetical protein [Roseiconus lacunae]
MTVIGPDPSINRRRQNSVKTHVALSASFRSPTCGLPTGFTTDALCSNQTAGIDRCADTRYRSGPRANQLALVTIALLAALLLGAKASTAVGQDVRSHDDVIVIASRSFDIPFHINGQTSASSVKLYVSTDKGESWQIATESPLPVEKLHFEASTDGEHWFAHAITSDDEADRASLSAERKIVIDTTGPSIGLTGEANMEGTLSARLVLDDPRQLGTLRILYATDVNRQWITLNNDSVDTEGNFKIQPSEDWKQIVLHVTALDSLGNASVQSKTFRRPRIATLPSKGLAGVGLPPVKTAAGPSDPPQLRIGPPIQSPPNQPTFTSPNSPFNANGLRPESVPERVFEQKSPSTWQDATVASPSTQPPSTRQETFGLDRFGLRGTDLQNARTRRLDSPQSRMSPIAGTTSAKVNADADQLAQLPPGGLSAKITPEGIEVLPPPNAEKEPAEPMPGNTSDTSGSSSPSQNPPQVSPQPVERIETPDAEAANSLAKPSISLDAPQRPDTIKKALQPITPTEKPSDQTTINGSPEQIPAPAAERSEERRHRVEKAEASGREQQRQFDLAQLARSVPYRFSETNQFSLEYELEAVGATGVESVELYGSLDGGGTWQRWGADPDRQSPFDIITKGEGLFSFRIVVLGNNGLASPSPLAGDKPDIAVLVDQTPPSVRITSARYGEGDRVGSLVVEYDCSDEHLTTRPIALAFSDSLAGPWTTIAAGLQNNGVYVWPADPKLPGQIYLRIDAIDKAGNTGSYLLEQPIQTSGLAPRARILGFRTR